MTRQIFVVGNSRSGTTMVARLLGLHSEAADLREMHFIEQMVSGPDFLGDEVIEHSQALLLGARLVSVIRDGYFFGTDGAGYLEETKRILTGPTTAADIFAKVRFAEAKRLGKSVPIDQTPRNVFYIKEILAKYPDARIVVMVRDPRDVLLSQKGKWKRRKLGANIPLIEAVRSWANYHPLVTAKIWNGAVRAGDLAAEDPRVAVVRFEDITASPEEVVKSMCAHCGIDFEPQMLSVARAGSSDIQDEKGASGIDASRVGRWRTKLSPAEIGICEAQSAALMQKHGYDLSGKSGSGFHQFLWTAALPAKMTLSLVLNLKRVRNLQIWAKKRMAGR